MIRSLTLGVAVIVLGGWPCLAEQSPGSAGLETPTPVGEVAPVAPDPDQAVSMAEEEDAFTPIPAPGSLIAGALLLLLIGLRKRYHFHHAVDI